MTTRSSHEGRRPPSSLGFPKKTTLRPTYRRKTSRRRPLTATSLLLASLVALAPTPALADCECGYAAPVGASLTQAQTPRFVFTDLLETDFAHLGGSAADGGGFVLSGETTGWSPQQYNFTRAANRGQYGESFLADNVVVNPSSDPARFVSGTGKDGTNPPGLRLLVKPPDEKNGPKGPSGELVVPTAELSSARMDMLYGSFRASLKMTSMSGTCAAFFWVGEPPELGVKTMP